MELSDIRQNLKSLFLFVMDSEIPMISTLTAKEKFTPMTVTVRGSFCFLGTRPRDFIESRTGLIMDGDFQVISVVGRGLIIILTL